MSNLIDVPARYLELAIENFERAQQANSPELQAKFRKLAGDYREKALEMLSRLMQRTTAFERVAGKALCAPSN
jgi:predicted nuclease of restriction endonuclease-like RecB superfamily